MALDVSLIQMIARENSKKSIFLLALTLSGLLIGIFCTYWLHRDRIETRVFLGSFPISEGSVLPAKDFGRPIEVLARAQIIPEVLAELAPSIGSQAVLLTTADATIVITSSVSANNDELFRDIHQKIADRIRDKSILYLAVQRDTIIARVKALEASIAARKTSVGKIDGLDAQLAEATSQLEGSSKTDSESSVRRCRTLDLVKRPGESEVVCDWVTAAAEQKALAARTALQIAIDSRENRLKIEDLEAALKINQAMLSGLFVNPSILSVAAVTSAPKAVFGTAAALLGALLGLISGIALLIVWATLKELALDSRRSL